MSLGKIRDERLRDAAVYQKKESYSALISVHSESAAKQVMSIIADRSARYVEFARLLFCHVTGKELSRIITIGGVYHIDPNRDFKLKPLPGSTKKQKMVDEIHNFRLGKEKV
jgi:hypothetical protein